MDKLNIATLIISAVASNTFAIDCHLPTTTNDDEVHIVNFLRAKEDDIIVMEDGGKVFGLLEGDLQLQFSFGKINFPKKQIAMILKDPDHSDKYHIVTSNGQSYVGTPVKGSMKAYSIAKDQTQSPLKSFLALMPKQSTEVSHPDSSVLYSIRFHNGDRLTAVIVDQMIHLKNDNSITSIHPNQIVKLSKSEGMRVQQQQCVESKFGFYVSDQYLAVVIPANDQLCKLDWGQIDNVQKYDPMYDEETFEAVATLFKPVYSGVNKNQKLLVCDGFDQLFDEEIGFDISEELVITDFAEEENFLANDEADQLFSEELGFEVSDELVITDFSQEENFIANDKADQLFSEEFGFEVSDELVITDFSEEENLLASYEADRLFSEEFGFEVSDELVITDFSEEENFIANDKADQLFSEELGFEVSDELVITDFTEKDVMLADFSDIEKIVIADFIEKEIIIAGSTESAGLETVTSHPLEDEDEWLVDCTIEEFERLFESEVNEERLVEGNFLNEETDNDFLVGRSIPKLLDFDDDHVIAMNDSNREAKKMNYLIADEKSSKTANDEDITVFEEENDDESWPVEDPDSLPESILNNLSVILDDGWVETPVDQDRFSSPFIIIELREEERDGKSKMFAIGKKLVSNEEYNQFAEATNRNKPMGWRNGKIPYGEENKPVKNVSDQDAKDYANWKHKRLPTRRELTKALELGLIYKDGVVDEWIENPNLEEMHGMGTIHKGFRLAEDIND